MSSRLVCIKIGTWRQSGKPRSARADIEAVHARHDHVEHHAIRRMRAKLVERARPSAAVIDAKSRHLQRAADQQAGAGIVVDDEYGCRRMSLDCRFAASDPLAPRPRSASAPASTHRKILDIPCGSSAATRRRLGDAALAHQQLAFLGERGQPQAAQIGGAGLESMQSHLQSARLARSPPPARSRRSAAANAACTVRSSNPAAPAAPARRYCATQPASISGSRDGIAPLRLGQHVQCQPALEQRRQLLLREGLAQESRPCRRRGIARGPLPWHWPSTQ